MSGPLQMEMLVEHKAENVERVRRAVHQATMAVFGSMDLADALSMVASELLENSFHYGRLAPWVRLSQRGDDLTVSITNALAATRPEHLTALQQRVTLLNGFRDPADAFREALSQRTRSGDVSGLGLARVIYEGDCRLECDMSQPGEVTVRATCPVSRFTAEGV